MVEGLAAGRGRPTDDLQAVEPNRLDSRVSRLPHCGQRTDSASVTGTVRRGGPVGRGGAMPYAASLARPASDDVVGGPGRREHELDVDVLVAGAGQPVSTRSSAIVSIAGQPE